ncbi:MAG: alpha/beta hydrolase, partial [Planctomycetota bacterium]
MQNTEQRSTTFWGNPLHFRVSGDSDPEGETVVFLNAGALGGELQPFEAIFGRQVRTIGIDLPGYASSGPVPPSYSPDYLADAALVVLDELGIQRATFVGAFWTASVAYRLAQKYPERVTRLAVGGLSATSSRSRLAWLEECVAALDARHLTQFAAELEGVFVADDESEERDLAARVRERVANLNDLERRRWECNAQRAIAYP